jgi:excinuclease UvrABC nuclease subunit
MNNKIIQQIKNLPQKPGVYLFHDKAGRILYTGKAIKIKNRVQSHFIKGNEYYRKEWLDDIAKIDFILTKNEKEALLLENDLIKKYQPRFNIQWKDDKSYFWVEITGLPRRSQKAKASDEWPRMKIVHKPSLRGAAHSGATKQSRPTTTIHGVARNDKIMIGPFVSGTELKQVLRALRRIFPYRTCKNSYDKPCLQWHLGLCPAHNNQLSLTVYLQSLHALAQILRLYAGETIRIEAYDISNIQGTNATGSMIVFAGTKLKKSDYRKFKIKTVRGANDIAMLKEVLRRRLNHQEWPLPNLILIDGGRAQLNAAKQTLAASGHSLVPVVSLAKREEEIYTIYSNKVLQLDLLPTNLRLTLQSIRNEAHRFAIKYYRHLHGKQFRTTPKRN